MRPSAVKERPPTRTQAVDDEIVHYRQAANRRDGRRDHRRAESNEESGQHRVAHD